jgi:hypothetical protein
MPRKSAPHASNNSSAELGSDARLLSAADKLRSNMEQFNASERLWQSLAGKRKLRRKLRPKMATKRRTQLDLLDFAKMQPPPDCIGEWDNP